MRKVIAMAAAMAVLTPAAATAQASRPTPAVKEKRMTDEAKIAVVRRMIAAWDTMDWKLVGNLFTEDGVLHSMMIEPVVGRAEIAKRIEGLGAGATKMKLNIRNIGVIGSAVFVERVDEFTYKGKEGHVPVVGVIEVEGDKIKEWREYYDRAELLKEMGVAQDFH